LSEELILQTNRALGRENEFESRLLLKFDLLCLCFASEINFEISAAKSKVAVFRRIKKA
jgi:hypothetical protein